MIALLVGHPWIQYILVNTIGFSVFLYIWTYIIPKPRPMDYTTIPGHKLSVNSEDDLPEWSIQPCVLVSTVAKDAKLEQVKDGHLPKIAESGSFARFLDRNEIIYGPLHSFWWSIRYVVVVSSADGIKQLQKYADAMLAMNPLAIGSVLQGDPQFWSRVPACSIVTASKAHAQPSVWLDPALQLTIAERGPFLADCADCKQETEPERLRRVVPQLAANINSEGVRRAMTYPLVVSFNKEIEIEAISGSHPVPAFIPIVIHNAALLRGVHSDELVNEYCKLLRWLPGFDDVEMLKIIQGATTPLK
ncbi:hypothetical protein PENTCL1PPCAC_9435 [Pristionchus entomophagus]|uniref:Uncharacterized protein n=1 Tax=Pristionchus entomophagus TaxID=358040 RepID=A0AAV5SVW3_9BILA|nr:hypothetical protein PENTCL1PPCAC_9435 [Pristionchus entomophagus]